MPKTFKDAHLDRFFNESETHSTHDTLSTHGTHKTHGTHTDSAVKHYRINLKLDAGHREYLERVSWENRKSITQYINDLIQADKDT